MNRFSPKRTLSNIATAVRETVDSLNMKTMKRPLLIMLSATVLIAPLRANAQSAADATATAKAFQLELLREKKEQDDEKKRQISFLKKEIPEKCKGEDANGFECKLLKGQLSDLTPGYSRLEESLKNTCASLASNIQTEASEANQNCTKAGYGGTLGKCYQTIAACNRANESLNGDDYDESNTDNYCNVALSNKCPGLPIFNGGQDYARDKKENEADRKDAKTRLMDLQSEKQRTTAEQAMNKIEKQENEQDSQIAAQRAEREIADRERAELKDVSDGKTKAYNAAKANYMNMENSVIETRQSLRAAAIKVVKAENDRQALCRGSAEKKYDEVEKSRQAALAVRKKNIGSGTAVSGSTRKRFAAIAQQRASDYAKFITACVNGDTADGKGFSNQIEAAKMEQKANEEFLADKTAQMEKARVQMLDDLKKMETEASNASADIAQKSAQRLKDMQQQRALTAQKNATRAAQKALQDTQSQSMLDTKIQDALRDLNKSSKLVQNAEDQLACQGRIAKRSESSRDRVSEGYSNSNGNIDKLAQYCDQAKLCPGVGDSPSCLDATRGVKSFDKDNKQIRVNLPGLESTKPVAH